MPEFHKILTVWYQENKRDLPWRQNIDPYFIWVSEIILQQTRVVQGKDYFLRFIERFPDVLSLANAPENEVLKVWQGLGYYTRARNIHQAAGQIKNDLNGVFPDTFEKIKKLKGVGDYTAAAIASIAFGLPHAALDGNVYRVLSRIFGISTPIDSTLGKKEFSDLANHLLDRDNPSVFNEAMMEFGALQCIPRNPECGKCPFQEKCISFAHSKTDQLPVKAKKNKVRHRFFHYLYIKNHEHFFLEKREDKDIWHNLYQLPLIESPKALTIEELMNDIQFNSVFNGTMSIIDSVGAEIVHILSHQKLHVRFIEISTQKLEFNKNWIRILPDEVPDYPIPKLIDNFLLEKNRNKMPG
jgi:A/G-specific adenine glycosylase